MTVVVVPVLKRGAQLVGQHFLLQPTSTAGSPAAFPAYAADVWSELANQSDLHWGRADMWNISWAGLHGDQVVELQVLRIYQGWGHEDMYVMCLGKVYPKEGHAAKCEEHPGDILWATWPYLNVWALLPWTSSFRIQYIPHVTLYWFHVYNMIQYLYMLWNDHQNFCVCDENF